jgi:hypothetical protein
MNGRPYLCSLKHKSAELLIYPIYNSISSNCKEDNMVYKTLLCRYKKVWQECIIFVKNYFSVSFYVNPLMYNVI